MIGSPISAPSETTIALAPTPSETKPSTRAWLPSATRGRAGETLPGAKPHLRRDLIAEEADDAGSRQYPQVRELLRVDQPLDRLVERHARRDEDGEDDGEPGQLLAAEGAHVERDPERQRRQCVTEVVDQVGQQRDRARQDEDRDLHSGNKPEYGEAERDGLDTRARAHDRAIDEPVRVAVLTVMMMFVLMLMRVWLNRL